MQHVWVEPLAAPHRKMSLILRPGQQLNLKDIAHLLGFDPEAPLRLHLANNTVSEIPMAGQVTVNWPLEDLQILTGRAGCERAPFLLQNPGMDAAQNSEPGQGTPGDGRAHDAGFTTLWEALKGPGCHLSDNLLHCASSFAPLYDKDTIYVRKSHIQLTKMALEMQTSNGLRKMLVSGTPGTGKKLWQLHLQWRLAQQDATVVLDWKSSNRRYLLSSSGCYQGDKGAFQDELRDRETWFLVDAQIPEIHPAITVETSSPSKSNTWGFIKRGVIQRTMPVWSLRELEAARHLYPEVTRKKLKELYKKWGGSIRWCLLNAGLPDNESILNDGIASTNVSLLWAAMANKSVLDWVSESTIHMIANNRLRWTHYAFASDHVADQIVIQQLEQARNDLELFVASSPGMAEFAQVRSHLFKAYVHRAITQGGTFDMRDLQTGFKSILSRPPMETFKFKDLTEVAKQPDNTYCLPKSQTQESIDFLCQPCEMGQVTTNLNHGANAPGLHRAYNALTGPQSGQQAWLTFIVPPDKFDAFKLQTITGEKPLAQKYNIKQRVISMPSSIYRSTSSKASSHRKVKRATAPKKASTPLATFGPLPLHHSLALRVVS